MMRPMPPSRPTDRVNTIAYVLLGTAFVAMALIAGERALRLEARMVDEQHQRAQADLQRILSMWEAAQLERVRVAVVEMSADPQASVQSPPAWLDGAYLWQREAGARAEQTLLYPPPAAAEDIATLLRDPCMARAQAAATPQADRVVIAHAWQACAGAAPPVALLAVSRAADQLMADQRPADALAALQAVDVPLFPPPEMRVALGLTLDRLLARQLQAAEADVALGNTDLARTLLVRVGRDILALEGPELDRALPYIDFPVLADLRALGASREADQLQAGAQGVRRRLAGYREVARMVASSSEDSGPLLLRAQVAGTSQDTRPAKVPVTAVVDPLGDRRYLLAIAALPGGLHMALQIDPDVLLAALMADGPGRPLRILDAKGAVVLPQGAPLAALEAQVPFGRLFPELRLGVLADPEGASASTGWRLAQLAPIGVALLIAVVAMAARIRADRQLRELWERQQAFVNRVSHELKTPLAGVKVMADLVAMDIVTDPVEIKQNIQRIITEVSRMEDRVNEVLRLARRPEITSREPMDIAAITQELVDIWAPRFEARGARLTFQLEDTAPVLGDPPLIRDAMSNLLDNALKYLSDERPGLVRVRTSTTERWIIFEVMDNGIGVPENMRRSIFERFTRVEGEGRGKAGGHGLGLAFVAEAVAGHGGKVECRDGITGGARFVIRLRRS